MMKLPISYMNPSMPVPDGTVWQEVSPGYQAEADYIQYQEPPQTLDEIACCRYGIQIRNGPYTRLQLAERMDWEKAMRIMGEEDRQVQDKRLEEAIPDMLQCLINIDRTGASDPPASLWDLHPENALYLFRRQDTISIVTVKNTNQDKVYLIRSNLLQSGKNSQWSLVLSNPAAALECVRRKWGPHYSDIALQLILRGCAFSMRIRGPMVLYKTVCHYTWLSTPRLCAPRLRLCIIRSFARQVPSDSPSPGRIVKRWYRLASIMGCCWGRSSPWWSISRGVSVRPLVPI